MIRILIGIICFSNLAYALFEQCNEPFGQKLGASNQVVAYSNCNEKVNSHQKNHLELDYPYREYYTGMKWQSVEYARRWLIYNKGILIPRVESAFSIWNLHHFKDLDGHLTVTIEKHLNKQSRHSPQVGDLVIYNQELCKNGHVSVVVGIKPDSIMLAEQNYFNLPWEGIDYARRLDLRHTDSGGFWIVDNHIIGWLHPKRYSLF
jgi:hypothetical protein